MAGRGRAPPREADSRLPRRPRRPQPRPAGDLARGATGARGRRDDGRGPLGAQSPAVGLAIRPALADDLETLLEIQREAAVAAFGHIFPRGTDPLPSDEIPEGWGPTPAHPDIETHTSEVEG